MAIKPRRESDIVKSKSNDIKKALTDYDNYFNGESALPVTFYQIADEATRTEQSLENSSNIIGTESSLKYNRIKHIPVYGMNIPDIQTQLTQRGLEDFITGDFTIIPSTGITPRIGEMFSIECETEPQIESHLFQITDVQYDRATSDKFYKCSYKLYTSDTDNIFGNLNKTYIFDKNGKGNHDGVGNSNVITEEENVYKDKIEKLIDVLIDTYKDYYYNEGMDTFTYQKMSSEGDFSYYWLPYLCHFIYKNEIMDKYNQEFLTEIYVQDVNETEFPNLYSEDSYRKSLYYAIESGNLDLLKLNSIGDSFIDVSSYDLNTPLSLPFFSSAEKYYLLDFNTKYNKCFWLGAFNWLYDNEDYLYCDIEPKYKYTGTFENYLITSGAIDSDGSVIQTSDFDIVNKTFYNIDTKGNIENIIYVPGNEDSIPYKADLYSILTSTSKEHPNYLINIIRLYLNNMLNINDTIINELQHYYYENSMFNFLIMPIIIFILKENMK